NLEEKQLEEERAAKAQNWKLPVCYDDDDDEERSDSLDDNIIFRLPPSSAITPDEPVLSTEELDNSLSMGDEHLDTICNSLKLGRSGIWDRGVLLHRSITQDIYRTTKKSFKTDTLDLTKYLIQIA
nr:hypothetical protein [Tanacetum cinerariifolium]